ncbi:MAG: FAD-dependent oxidoreductase [Simkania sp.]|nr:FAD-dependent oxidoreductase [Simkania sp.]
MRNFLFLCLCIPVCIFSELPIKQPLDFHKSEEEIQEAVVLGGGIGGLTSALYLSRANLHPLVITGQQPGGALTQSPLVQNWPGELSIRGNDLTEKIQEQAEKSGAKFEIADVVSVDFSTRPFKITVRDLLTPKQLRVIKAKTCIIATGATPKMLGIPGEDTYWLKGVHNCAVCDGNFYKELDVVVVGGGDGAITEASYLAKFAKKVTLVVRSNSLKSIEAHRKEELLLMPNVEVLYNTTIQEVLGDAEKMTSLVLKNSTTHQLKTLPANGLFLAIGSIPTTDLFKGQVQLDNKGYILLYHDRETSVPGVFAVGDACDPEYRQAVIAAGDGAKAALQAEKARSSPSSTPTSNIRPLEVQEPEIISIKSLEQFDKDVLCSKTPIIVDFYADWCGPCKALEPHIRNWSKRFDGKVKFAKVNIDILSKLSQRYSVRAVPTILYFDKGGVLIDSRTGMQEIAGLIDKLEGFSTSQ